VVKSGSLGSWAAGSPSVWPCDPVLAVTVGSPPLQPDQACALFKALADPIRLQVVAVLSGGERCVCDLGSDLGLAQSRLSFHLKVLKQAGLLQDRQQGRWTYYSLRPQALQQLSGWLLQRIEHPARPATPCG
jgi:ArsR family transcriptional regulator, arsenate/arsenite/antimonite-responsive transcriptional repressor